MATEQDWAAYADQTGIASSDSLLVRTAAGAGAEVPGSDVFARRGVGGRFTAEGDVLVGGSAPTSAGGLRYFDVQNAENTSGNSAAIYRLITRTADGSGLTAANLVKYRNGLFQISNDEPSGSGAIAFAIAGTERARIDASGRFLAGTNAALSANTAHEFKATGSTVWPLTANGQDRGLLVRNSANSGFYAYFEYNGGINNGSIAYSGSSTSYNTSSDYRLKVDLRPLTGCLDRIKALPVWDFEWVTTGERGHGFMAHEYGAVVNNGATGTKDGTREEEFEIEPARASNVLGPDGEPVMIPAVMGRRTVPDYQGVDQSKVTPYLVGAVQELAGIVESLSAKVAELEAAR